MLEGFTNALLLILVSELGDKSFLLAMLLAMRYPRWLVFAGVILALAVQTVIAAVAGQFLDLLPAAVVHWGIVALFLGFGGLLLVQAAQMQPNIAAHLEAEDLEEVQALENRLPKIAWLAPLLESFVLIFLAEWGDRTQIATVALAAAHNPVGVAAGAIFGHGFCSGLAVLGGKWVAGRISERVILFCGGGLFILFGLLAIFEHGI
ncbi:TMEM165/GDT1 family protein [Leptolyngbya sp. FACHB-261]|uniref:TMEM165/GDT1 family protein n=1 Tax=Leptolyngbya sp. FACHB-261 TaxID=2692806 RepID=UPI001681D6BA|nr:TMEM165/GDT1 family protein [Leptolyngbya sp. FACHB-261]MBD2099411.1 TMEM165/GDT1 family protein [Leptolyngbya sp. FACHB-261]